MPNLMSPILTGLSIVLMDNFDKYRANSVALINAAGFPTDVTLALRQQLNKDIDATIDIVASNPPAPVVATADVPFELPQLTPPRVQVFATSTTVPVTPIVVI